MPTLLPTYSPSGGLKTQILSYMKTIHSTFRKVECIIFLSGCCWPVIQFRLISSWPAFLVKQRRRFDYHSLKYYHAKHCKLLKNIYRRWIDPFSGRSNSYAYILEKTWLGTLKLLNVSDGYIEKFHYCSVILELRQRMGYGVK